MNLTTKCLAALLMTACPVVGAAQQSGGDLQSKTADFSAFIDAENAKSTQCLSYVGKAVTVAGFDATALRLKGAGEKGEFETTAQYEARQAAAAKGKPTVAIVLVVPIARDYVRYDADAGAITLLAGAFPTGTFSEAVQADIAAGIMMAGGKYTAGGSLLTVGVSQTERPISTEAGRTGLGVPIRIANVDRHTRGLSLRANRLFPFAKDGQSTIMGFAASQAQAPRLKQTIRTAIVLEPLTPYVVTGSMSGAAATAREPIHYTERSTVIIGTPKCGLVLDDQSRVLASADAAPQ